MRSIQRERMVAKRRSKKNKNTPGAPRAGAPAQAANDRRRTASLEVTALEIAKGYDGPLRGMPEPVLLVAVFEVEGPQHRVHLLHRRILRFDVNSKIPGVYHPAISVDQANKISVRIETTRTLALIVVVIAVEEDSGQGLARIYTALEQPENLSLWRSAAPIPDVHRLGSLPPPAGGEPDEPFSAIRLMIERDDASERATGDDYVAAAVMRMSVRSRAARRACRATFASGDARNIWTACIDLSLR